jgi:hypothetical protein
MQRPRLTERTAEALAFAHTILRGHHESMDEGDFAENGAKTKRALTYLEDLLRWHRAKTAET